MGSAIDSIFGSSGEGGKNAGSVYSDSKNALGNDAWLNEVNKSATINAGNNAVAASGRVQNNPILSQLFGPQGVLSQTVDQQKELANRGYSLQPEDHEAYGQASGNIARMFGSQEQGLAQSLADRGLSNSGAAGAAFSGLNGNKQEQLAGLQTQIAQKRMEMNQQRLGQMQNFLGTMGNQAQGAIGQELGAENNRANNMYNMGMGYLGAKQGQENEKLSQYQSTNHASGAGQIGGALLGGAANAGFSALGNRLGGSSGGTSGSSGGALK